MSGPEHDEQVEVEPKRASETVILRLFDLFEDDSTDEDW